VTSVATYRFADPPDQVSGVQFRYSTPTRLETALQVGSSFGEPQSPCVLVVGGFHKAGLGRNPTTKNSRDADTLPTNADKFTISPTNLL